jgi:N-acetylmuramoyl-L-alanine amidase
MNDNFCVFLDAGHGGVNPLGLYTTAPGKQFQHQQGQFHNGSWFYEGVWNRNLVARVIKKLDILGIQYLPVYHEYVDFPLQYRVDQANWYYRNYRRGIFLSTHANASGVGARGYEIYTSPGETSSIVLPMPTGAMSKICLVTASLCAQTVRMATTTRRPVSMCSPVL